MNHEALVFANDKEFGLRPSKESSLEGWDLEWKEIQAVTMGVGWVAVANDELIRVFNLMGHPVNSIAFDRQIVAMHGYENMLAVVFHEGVPIWGAQQLAMQLFMIDAERQQFRLVDTLHVPIKPGQQLKWFNFSREGMIFSQDTVGVVRCFSMETNQWTRVVVQNIEEHLQHKIWIISFGNYCVDYWRISDQDPEPTVAPRFSTKTSELAIPVIGILPNNT